MTNSDIDYEDGLVDCGIPFYEDSALNNSDPANVKVELELDVDSITPEHYKGFTNVKCEFYPCHSIKGDFNCLFCYCPLYLLDCKGKFKMIGSTKDCSNCDLPHKGIEKSWNFIQKVLSKT